MCSPCSEWPDTHNESLLNSGPEKRGNRMETNHSNSSRRNPEIDPLPKSFNLETMGDTLFEDLARFLRTLPSKSKQHIWEHAVKIKTADGQKTVCDQTSDEDQINLLLCDCIIVYIKYLDRNKASLSIKKVRPHVKQIAVYIFNKFNPLQQ